MKTQNITTLVALALFNYFSFVIPAPDTRIKADNPKIDPPRYHQWRGGKPDTDRHTNRHFQ